MKRINGVMGIAAAALGLAAATAGAHGMGYGMGGMGYRGMGPGHGGCGMGPAAAEGAGWGCGGGPGARGGWGGNALFSAEERNAFRDQMIAAKTPEERQKVAAAHRAEMQKRAAEKGLEAPCLR